MRVVRRPGSSPSSLGARRRRPGSPPSGWDAVRRAARCPPGVPGRVASRASTPYKGGSGTRLPSGRRCSPSGAALGPWPCVGQRVSALITRPGVVAGRPRDGSGASRGRCRVDPGRIRPRVRRTRDPVQSVAHRPFGNLALCPGSVTTRPGVRRTLAPPARRERSAAPPGPIPTEGSDPGCHPQRAATATSIHWSPAEGPMLPGSQNRVLDLERAPCRPPRSDPSGSQACADGTPPRAGAASPTARARRSSRYSASRGP